MNRRTLLKSAAAAGALALLPIALPVAGCTFVAKGLLNVVISAVQSILKVASSASWATELSNALAALVNAESTWETGGAAAIVIDALNTVEAVCAVIPLTAAFSPLIDVLVAGIEAVISYFAPQPAPASNALGLASNPHRRRVALNKPHFLETREGAFKAQWNQVAAGIGLPQAKI
jgi:hypothetical protein